MTRPSTCKACFDEHWVDVELSDGKIEERPCPYCCWAEAIAFMARRNGIPAKCNGCGGPLLLENLYVDDGCVCNSPRGINFKPRECALCKDDHCVKPGHRLAELFEMPS